MFNLLNTESSLKLYNSQSVSVLLNSRDLILSALANYYSGLYNIQGVGNKYRLITTATLTSYGSRLYISDGQVCYLIQIPIINKLLLPSGGCLLAMDNKRLI